MGLRYPQPDNELDFEQLCLRLYRKLWKNEHLKLFAKRGEKQDGLDIFDPLFIKPVRAVQCKHHEPDKTIPPSEIKTEVARVEASCFEIDHYVIATTAKKSRKAQETVADLNRRNDKKFTVDIHFWEEICQHASEFGKVMAELIIYGENILAGALTVSHGSMAPASAMPSPAEKADDDHRFAAIETLLTERKFEAARHELDKLSSELAVKLLQPSDQYKLLRLRGKLELETGGFDLAGKLFLQAYSVTPDLDQAKQNQVLGFSLLGDAAEAYSHAKRYVDQGLRTPIMVVRLIESTTSIEQLDENKAAIHPHVEADEGVNTALAHKYIQFGDYERARTAAERALKLSQDSAFAHFAAAIAVHSLAVHGELRMRSAHLTEAIGHYDAAYAAAKEKQLVNLLPEILVNRASVMMLSGDGPRAAADFEEAVKSSKQPSIYLAPAIRFFIHEDAFATAKSLLGCLDQVVRETQYLTLIITYNTGDQGEKRRSLDEMKELADQEWESSVECHYQCVQWALELNLPDLAERCVDTAFQEKHPFQAHTMLAWIRLEARDLEQASAETQQALDASIVSAHPQELRILAHILVKLKNDGRAIDLLEQVAKPGVLDDDMRMLIDCAQRLERHDLLLRLCQELRASGAQDDVLRKLEMQLLARYSPREALALADEFIAKSTTAAYFRAAKNVVATRLNLRDQLNLDPAVLPTPAELPHTEVSLILFPYVAAGMYADALRFLYVHLRLNFEDEHAHGNYICFLLVYGHHIALQEPSGIVDDSSAVLLDVRGGGQRWITIEGDHPASSRGEFAPASDMGQCLIGRKPGDVVDLPGNPLQPDTATLREIQSKYVRVFQDSIQNFVQRFPTTSMLQQLRLWNEDKFDPSIVIKSLKGRQEHAEKCIDVYRDNPCSMFLVAEKLGISEFEFMKSMTQYEKGLVKCSQASPVEFARAAETGIQTDSVVLAISAIITLSLLDGWRFLDPKKHYLVSQLTVDAIEAWARIAADDRGHEGGEVSLNQADQLVFRRVTPENRAARLDEINRIKTSIAERCEVVSSKAVADIPPEKRSECSELIGLHNLEAISVAKDRNAALCVDDLVVGFVASAEFGVKNVWTQLMLRCFVNSGFITLPDFDLVTAKLAAWNYVSIVWNPAAIIAAGIAAEWKIEAWPLSQCVNLIAKSPLSKADKVQIVIELLRLLRRSNCNAVRQTTIVQATLNALGDANAVRWILQRLNDIFGLDLLSALFLRPELLYWLRLR